MTGEDGMYLLNGLICQFVFSMPHIIFYSQCHSAELSAPQRAVLAPDVDESADPVVAAAGEGHERQAQGLLGGLQAAQGVGR